MDGDASGSINPRRTGDVEAGAYVDAGQPGLRCDGGGADRRDDEVGVHACSVIEGKADVGIAEPYGDGLTCEVRRDVSAVQVGYPLGDHAVRPGVVERARSAMSCPAWCSREAVSA